MHIPPPFAESRDETMLDFVEANPLGALVTVAGDGLLATHLPFVVDRERRRLLGHVARANPQAAPGAGDAGRGLVIFAGPSAYVSPGHYESKRRHGRVVPTWNYVAVHVHGVVRVVDDLAFVMRNVEALTARHEAGQPVPWAVGDAPSDFVRQLLGATVGVEVEIARLEGLWKMSQNRPSADIDGVVSGLGASSDPAERAVAALVAERRPAR